MFAPILVHAHNPGPMTGDGNNTFLIVGDAGNATLIDAGQGSQLHLTALADRLHDIGGRLDGGRLDRVLVTHAHPDHAAGAPALARAYPAARFLKFPWPGEDDRFGVVWRPLHDGT